MPIDRLKKRYDRKGFKLTPQRLAILRYLEKEKGHPSAENIYMALKKDCPTISIATVYNTLQALQDMGEIREIVIDPERKHYCCRVEPHHHIICTECRKIYDIFADYSQGLELPDEFRKKFKVTSAQVVYYGICNECREKGNEKL
ncbi:MAG TPA: transcriptional repressor [Thermodesulfobacteriota bacterium]|nr:transcriptional repressor [Thermodesulfobacteriota bacterium]